MQFLRRAITGSYLFIISLMLLVVGVYQLHGAFGGSYDEPQMLPQERDYEVSTKRVTLSSIVPEIKAVGKIYSSRQLEIRVSHSGIVNELANQFYDGGIVEKNALVYRLDTDTVKNQLATLKLTLSGNRSELSEAIASQVLASEEVETASLKLELVTKKYKRQQTLFAKNLVSRAAVEQAELSISDSRQLLTAMRKELLAANLRIDQARHSVDKSLLDIGDASKRLRETSFDAPFRGVLSDTSATTGGRLSENEKIAVLVDPTAMEVSFRVQEEEFVRLVDLNENALSPAPIRVELDLAGQVLSVRGRLDRMAATHDNNQGGYQIFGRLDSVDNGLIRSGDIVDIYVETNMISDVVSLPTHSLSAADIVYLVDSESRIRSQVVNVIHRDSDHVIVSGLRNGDLVVLNQKEHLGPGVKVRVAKNTDLSHSTENAKRLANVRVQQE